MIASAPTFFVAMESNVTAPVRTGTWERSVFSSGITRRIASSMTPDRAKAAETISAQAMMTVTSFLKPSNAASAGMMPIASPATNATTATRS